MGLDINNLWTKKDSEHLECLLHRYEQVLEEAGDLRAQILRVLNTRKTDFKNTIKVTERIRLLTSSWALLITLTIKKSVDYIRNCSVCNVEQRFKPDEILVGRVFQCKKCEEFFEITSVDHNAKSAISKRLKNGQEIINDLKKLHLSSLAR